MRTSAKGLASYAFCMCLLPARKRRNATAAVDDNRWGIPHSYSPMEHMPIIHESAEFVK